MGEFTTPESFMQRFITEDSSHAASFNSGVTVTFPAGVLLVENGAGTALATNRRSVIDTGGAFATPIVLTAADSSNIYLLDDAAGLDFTLPAITADTIGMQFEFRLTVEVTSNSYRWTAQSGDLLTGMVRISDKDLAEGSTEALQQIFRPNGSTETIITIAGADDTTGALVGGWLELTALTATSWGVRGELIGDGSLATIFSAPA